MQPIIFFNKRVDGKTLTGEDEKLIEKLKNHIKKDVNVIIPDKKDFGYELKPSASFALPVSGLEELELYNPETGEKIKYDIDPKKKTIVSGNNSEVLAHEFGHTSSSRIQRMSSKYEPHGRKLSTLGSIGFGIKDGIKEGKSGEEQSGTGYKVSQLGLALEPINEADASIRGYKTLKKLGANSNQLSKARKNLLLAGGTYATRAAAGLGVNKVLYESTKSIAKRNTKKKEEK